MKSELEILGLKSKQTIIRIKQIVPQKHHHEYFGYDVFGNPFSLGSDGPYVTPNENQYLLLNGVEIFHEALLEGKSFLKVNLVSNFWREELDEFQRCVHSERLKVNQLWYLLETKAGISALKTEAGMLRISQAVNEPLGFVKKVTALKQYGGSNIFFEILTGKLTVDQAVEEIGVAA